VKIVLRSIFLIAGLGLVAWYGWKAGPTEIIRSVSQLGWWTPVVLVPYFFVYLFDTLGWFLAFGTYAPVRPAYWSLFRIRWAAESINTILPSGYLAGEAMKVYLLHKRGISGLSASTSVVASKTAQTVAHVCFIGLGAAAASAKLPAENKARIGMILIAVAAWVVLGLLFFLQRRGMFSSVLGLFSRFSRFASLKKRQASLRTLDDQVFAFYRQDHRRFFLTGAAYLAGWLGDAVEVYLVCALLGLPLSYPEAVAIEAFISVAKGLGIFVPGAIGVQESGVVLLFKIFALPPPIAIVYAVLRRGRDLFYVLVGGALLYSEEASFKQVLSHAAAEASEKNSRPLVPEPTPAKVNQPMKR
jgi:uncharacterized protein (TIRG00374 family)